MYAQTTIKQVKATIFKLKGTTIVFLIAMAMALTMISISMG
jgi:hypothetical protein